MAIEKRFTHRIDIKAEDIKLIGTVVQNDHFRNVVVVRLVDGVVPVDISGAAYVTVTYLLNGNSICVDAMGERINITDYENGEISIILADGAIVYTGDVVATVDVYEGEGGGATRLTSGKFAYRVVPDLSLTMGVNVDVTEDQLSIIQQMVTAETERTDNEGERVANEAGRETAEGQRESAEQDRASAELNRAAAESDRALEFAAMASALGDLQEAYRDYNPSITVHPNDPEGTYRLDITYTDATSGVTYNYTTPNLKGDKGDTGAAGRGTGDMLASVYDTNSNGKVDTAENAEKLDSHARSYFATRAALSDYVRISDIGNLYYRGRNPVLTYDNPPEWATLGTGIWFFNSSSTGAIHKPVHGGTGSESVAGLLLNICTSTNVVHQIWLQVSNHATIWTRAGDGTDGGTWNGDSDDAGTWYAHYRMVYATSEPSTKKSYVLYLVKE